jgi:hypothetical protein
MESSKPVGICDNSAQAMRLHSVHFNTKSLVVGIAAMSEPTGLTLRLLGEVEVARGGERLPLPTSRKARALLTYLVSCGHGAAAPARPTLLDVLGRSR